MQRSYFPFITAGWLILTLSMAGLSLYADYSRLKKSLSNDAHFVYSSVYEKAYINEVLLQSFTVLVSSTPNDQESIRSFANEMRKRYPHIERLQIQQQKKPLSPSYGIAENYNVDPTKDDFKAIFPVTFIEPLNPDTRYLLNTDLLSDPVFTETIRFARKYHQPVTSPPFLLDNNKTGYGLFLAFFERNTAPSHNNLFIASLVINTAGMLPNTSFLSEHASISLMDEKGEILDQHQSDARIKLPGWLPQLEETRTVNRFGQSFTIKIVHNFGPKNINLGMLLILLSASLAVYFMLIAYLQQKVQAAVEQSSIYATLKNERQQLETRIHTRTRELRDQLIENRRLTHQVLAVQERERRNLSRELHDELGQSLTAIRTDAKILKRIHPEESSVVNQTAESIDAIAQNIYDVTYGMMRALRPSALDDLGLVDAIQECIVSNRFEEHGITLHSDYRGPLNEMSEDYNITLFRLAQEAFSNIIKYAQAHNVWLDIHRTAQGQRKEISGDRLEIVISDDGCGFDIEKDAFRKGFGLIGMRERVRALGGFFQISKNHDKGTRIIAIIPIPLEVVTDLSVTATPDPEAPVEPVH
ncbi:ATP-binding protein [uncultured Amphritea sp.]|uniref:ATP-binding protein n=1 Tax=uncultured Amphritea sp. TaxID=981605 RepID=UPI00261EE039|nr:ATP-binding protein [uncultured Amphritea sp.]